MPCIYMQPQHGGTFPQSSQWSLRCTSMLWVSVGHKVIQSDKTALLTTATSSESGTPCHANSSAPSACMIAYALSPRPGLHPTVPKQLATTSDL